MEGSQRDLKDLKDVGKDLEQDLGKGLWRI